MEMVVGLLGVLKAEGPICRWIRSTRWRGWLDVGGRGSGSGVDAARVRGATAGILGTDGVCWMRSGRGLERRARSSRRVGWRGEPGVCDLHVGVNRKTERRDGQSRRAGQLSEVGEGSVPDRRGRRSAGAIIDRVRSDGDEFVWAISQWQEREICFRKRRG